MIHKLNTDLILKDLNNLTGLKHEIEGVSSVSGGCIHSSYRIKTNKGSYFVKTNSISALANFEAERDGLELLFDKSIFKIPFVHLIGKDSETSWILTEYIPPSAKGKYFWVEFAEALAELHKNTSDEFGYHRNNYIGALHQKNTKHKKWLDFFIEERLEYQIKLASKEDYISKSIRNRFDKLYKRMEFIFPDEKPSLLHGDLWSGNFLIGPKSKPVLIDPAVYYGNREMEIAFTGLFGGFDKQFYESYDTFFPLEKDFRLRKDIYNLYPLLVHLNLFGTAYLTAIEEILEDSLL